MPGMGLATFTAAFLFVAFATADALTSTPPSFEALETPAGEVSSRANAVSRDGAVVVGESANAQGRTLALRWEAGAVADLGNLIGPGEDASAHSMSAYGRVVGGRAAQTVSFGGYGDVPVLGAFRWEAGEMLGYGAPVGEYCSIGCQCCSPVVAAASTVDISFDGSVLLVDIQPDQLSGDSYRVEGETVVPFNESWAQVAIAASATGEVMVFSEHFGFPEEFWKVTLPLGAAPAEAVVEALPGAPRDISGSGDVVVGHIGYAFDEEAYRFEDGSFEALPGGLPSATSYFGTVMVGASGGSAATWDAEHGWRELRSALIDAYGWSAELAGWQLVEATAISEDRRTLVGYGSNPLGDTQAWRVTVADDFFPPAPPVPAASEIPALPAGFAGLLLAGLGIAGVMRLRQISNSTAAPDRRLKQPAERTGPCVWPRLDSELPAERHAFHGPSSPEG